MPRLLRLVILTLLISACVPQAAVLPVTPTAPPAAPAGPNALPTLAQALLSDDFTTLSETNWLLWGKPAPMVQGSGDGSYLVLSGVEPRYESGITSRVDLPFLSSTRIRLAAHVPREWQQRDAWLVLDWDERPGVETARIQEGAIIRLLLLPGSVTLYTRETDLECNIPLDTSRPHTYTLALRELFEVSLWIDDQAEPACRHDYTDRIFEIARTGPLTLTGAGWVTYIDAGSE